MTLANVPTLLLDAQTTTFARRVRSITEKRIVWVMGDQGIVSVGNFLTFNLLARSLPAPQYGAFGVVLETILFLNSLQAALVIYPMSVAGAKGDERRLRQLVAGALLFTLLLLPVLGGLTGFATRTSNAWPVALSAVFALLTWQVQETTRRAMMASFRVREILLGDTISYLGQAAAVFSLARNNCLSVGSAFMAMGLTSLIAAVVQATQLRVSRVSPAQMRSQACESWRLGRWMLLSNMGGIVTSLGYLWMLRATHGLEAVAAFTALFAVTKPMNPVSSSLCGIITPAVARASADEDAQASVGIALRYGLLGCAIMALPFAFAFSMPATTLRLLYGSHSPYVAGAGLLRVMLLAYLMMFLSFILNAWLSGLGESRASCCAQGFTVAATALVALPMTAVFGVAGLVWGAMFAVSVGAAAAVFFIRRATAVSTRIASFDSPRMDIEIRTPAWTQKKVA